MKKCKCKDPALAGCLLEDTALFLLFDYSSYFTVENEGYICELATFLAAKVKTLLRVQHQNSAWELGKGCINIQGENVFPQILWDIKIPSA